MESKGEEILKKNLQCDDDDDDDDDDDVTQR
jgi:hypothetical protein